MKKGRRGEGHLHILGLGIQIYKTVRRGGDQGTVSFLESENARMGGASARDA